MGVFYNMDIFEENTGNSETWDDFVKPKIP
ncbi:MAG: hypothetical protein ACLUOI_27635 [Eisenbergiella sp.]